MFVVALPILLQNDQLIALTTPAGRRGWYYESFVKGNTFKLIARSPDIERMQEVVARDKKFLTEAQFNTEVMLQWQGSGEPFFRYSTLQKTFDTGRKALQSSLRPKKDQDATDWSAGLKTQRQVLIVFRLSVTGATT